MIHTALWLPLILLCVDKVFGNTHSDNAKVKTQKSKMQVNIQKAFPWLLIFVLSLVSSFFAGHLQVFFYVFVVSFAYVIMRWVTNGRSRTAMIFFVGCLGLFGLITAIQWIPTLQFIQLSARAIDQADWMREGWFLPLFHLVQFLSPDFFGNPTTLNYWGEWNYGEFIGYISIFPLVMMLTTIIYQRDRLSYFFIGVVLVSLILILPTVIGKLPYQLQIPFLSSSQPTRLMFFN